MFIELIQRDDGGSTQDYGGGRDSGSYLTFAGFDAIHPSVRGIRVAHKAALACPSPSRGATARLTIFE